MKLNIVTVVRNDEKGLILTLESVKKFREIMNLIDVHHIIIDGMSTDKTKIILERVSMYANTTVLSETDKSLFDGMNKALRFVGEDELIIYINAGDEILPVRQEDFLKALQKLKTDEMQLLFMQAECCWNNKSWIHPNCNELKTKEKFDKWLKQRTPVHQAVIFKNKKSRPIFYNTLMRIQADSLLIYELLEYYKWNYIILDQKIAKFYLGGLSNNYRSAKKNLIQFKEQLIVMFVRGDEIINYIRLPVIIILKYLLNNIMGERFNSLMIKVQKRR